jgi:hypothetical protein
MTSSKLKKLHNQDVNPFMLETDPRNPYGPNYEELPYETKLYYKFNRVRKYVHFEPEDQDKILKSNYDFTFGMIGIVTVGCLAGLALRRYGLKHIGKLDEMIDNYSNFYYGFFFAGSGTFAYYYMSDKYVKDICEPFLTKYTDKAVANGFDNYEISRFKKFQGNFKEYVSQN